MKCHLKNPERSKIEDDTSALSSRFRPQGSVFMLSKGKCCAKSHSCSYFERFAAQPKLRKRAESHVVRLVTFVHDMFNLLCELHFWSQKDGILVENSDFGAFLYHNKVSIRDPIVEGKKSYCERRGVAFSLTNKRPKKLRDSLTEFEEIFYENRVVRVDWKCSTVVRVVFDSGLQYYVKVNLNSGDPEEFVLDKFMIGKLTGVYLTDIAVYSHHAVFAYTDNHVTHIFMPKASFKAHSTKKLTHLDVKLQNVELAGPSGRRLDKVLSYNITGDMILMWWKCGRDEVYPWSPQVKAEDRANVHVYSLNGSKFDLVCFYRTKFDPVTISFSRIHHSTIYTIQQRVSDDGEVTLEWENARLDCRQLVNSYSLSLPLPTHVSALALSPREDKLLATCIDGSLLVADSYGNVANRVRTNLIPSLASWHPDGALILIANNKGQLQWFDSALAQVGCQILNQDATSTTLDVGCYFKYQPNLVGVSWNRRINSVSSHDEHSDFLLLHFEKGPLVLLKMLRSYDRKLTPDTIVYQYMSSGSYSNALNLLHTVDWEVDSELAMSSLQSAVGFLMRQPLSPATESAIEKSLGYFLNPIRPIPEAVSSEVTDGVLDLARKFFHLLLRYQCHAKAFRLAIDLGKRDLFMDLHHCCRDAGNHVMAAAAWDRAEEIGCSSCDESESSCDCSESHSESESTSSEGESVATQELQERIVPPLPITSPLESARTKVGYSSILQQHNYRRNPPKTVPTAASLPNPPKDGSQPAYIPNYLKKDLNGTCNSNVNDELFIEDSCIVHHPNIPSSRAPLQFNSHTTDHIFEERYQHTETESLCAKVLSGLNSDQTIGIPYTLKVANARRRNDLVRTHDDSGGYSDCKPPEEWFHNYRREARNGTYNGNHSLPTPTVKNDFGPSSLMNGTVRSPPEGNPSSRSYFEFSNLNKMNRVEISPGAVGLKLNAKVHPVISNYRLAAQNDLKSNLQLTTGKSRINHPDSVPHLNRVESNAPKNHICDVALQPSSVPPDVIDVSKKPPPEPPIIASAETEDGKIKVVHFGLV